jgi:hypothetical protein
MKFYEKIYFNKMRNYSPKRVRYIVSEEIKESIYYFTEKIKETANYALSEQISPNIARKEISDLLNDIKELKKEGSKNVREY